MTQLFFSELHDADHPPRQPLAILGAGGLGREILVLIHQINEANPTWDVVGFYDDQAPATASVGGIPYLGTAEQLNAVTEPLHVVVAVGSSRSRAAVVSRLTSPLLHFPALVHPEVALQPYQRIEVGAGCIITQGCILTTDIVLGRHVLLNLGCTLGHDAVLGDFCSLMPHANIGGEAVLETGVYVGTNATVLNRVTVGQHTVVGAGAVAVRNLPAHCTAVGVPAKELRMKKEE